MVGIGCFGETTPSLKVPGGNWLQLGLEPSDSEGGEGEVPCEVRQIPAFKIFNFCCLVMGIASTFCNKEDNLAIRWSLDSASVE
jgi:hypothetical protein